MRNVTILLAVVAMLAGTAGAAETLYEGFEYPVGSLNGQNGGSGFAAAWIDNSGYNNVVSGSLDCGGNPFTPAGNRVDDQKEGLAGAKRQLNATNSIDLSSDGTYYVSVLMKAGVYSTLRFAGSDYSTSPYITMAVNDDNYPNAKVFCQMEDEGQGAQTGVLGTTYFLVAKIETVATGNDKISMNVYETAVPPATEPGTWDLSSSGSYGGTLDYMHVWLNDGAMDEIRMGTTWGDVAVPEPATMVLLGIGGIGVLIRRRRK